MAMKAMGSWFSPAKSGSSSGGPLTAVEESRVLNEAMRAATLIMHDEVDRADAELGKGSSPFHKLGSATTLFLRATLGFEKDIMDLAAARLSEAEESASEHQRRTLRDPSSAHQSKIYPTGSEYALCQAEAQLMSAVLGVLNESLAESLRGFYKLRKAFFALQAIVHAENAYMEKHRLKVKTSAKPLSEDKREAADVSSPTVGASGHDEDPEDMEFEDAEEELRDQQTPRDYQGHIHRIDLDQNSEAVQRNVSLQTPLENRVSDAAAISAQEENEFLSVTSDPVDVFIHSGTSLCYGALQFILSMIPPAFARILSILSFRGDRENGLRLLWEATAFKTNVNGGLAGLVTLTIHNASVGLCDIHSREAYPEHRLRRLLTEMRSLYPQSLTWILEEGRMAAIQCQLGRAVDILGNTTVKTSLKQIDALRVFETSMALMFLHRYQECADSLERLVEINSWSHGLYYYMAGSCNVELYRVYRDSNDKDQAAKYKKAAKAFLDKVVPSAGKKRLLARQLPLDIFVTRKIAKWTARSKAWACDLVDAVGVSPLAEMTYFWSGYKRMGSDQLHTSLDRLAWSENANHRWKDEPDDERAILALLTAACHRCLGDTATARSILLGQALSRDWQQLKACDHADNWPTPVAHYELAIGHWLDAGGQDGDRAELQKCSDELAAVEKWESFDLDARIGLKLATARETLRRIGIGSSR